jgi:hypothetical protein
VYSLFEYTKKENVDDRKQFDDVLVMISVLLVFISAISVTCDLACGNMSYDRKKAK